MRRVMPCTERRPDTTARVRNTRSLTSTMPKGMDVQGGGGSEAWTRAVQAKVRPTTNHDDFGSANPAPTERMFIKPRTHAFGMSRACGGSWQACDLLWLRMEIPATPPSCPGAVVACFELDVCINNCILAIRGGKRKKIKRVKKKKKKVEDKAGEMVSDFGLEP
jgi:hypothetical protein